jgi:hypothetical protein
MTFSATLFGTKCPACGAPVPTPAPGAAASCPYCHASLHTDAASAYRLPSGPQPSAAPSRFGVFGLVGALTALPAIIGLVVGVGAMVPAFRHGISGAVKVGTLGNSPFEGWTAIDAPGMVGTFESFDAVANLGWAHGLARSWKPDAALFRIDTDRVASSGKVDIVNTPDGSVEYRFTSPACVAAYKGSTAVADPQSKCELDVKIELYEGKPVVRALASSMMISDTERPIKDPACSLARSFAALKAANALLDRPVYNAAIYDFSFPGETQESPRWTFSTVIHGQGEIPNVDATSCVVAGHEPPPAAATHASATPAPESKPGATVPGQADEPASLTWTGRITSSKGAAPRVGSPCTLTATVAPRGVWPEQKRTTLVCAGQTLYDTDVPLMGMADTLFEVGENRVPGDAEAFTYGLSAKDLGPRAGERAQFIVFTPKHKMDAFREGASPFRVHVEIAAESGVRHGKPLASDTLKTPVPAAPAPKTHPAAPSAHRPVAHVARR